MYRCLHRGEGSFCPDINPAKVQKALVSLSPDSEHLLQSEKAHLYGKHWTLIYSIYTHIHIHVSRTNFFFHLIYLRKKTKIWGIVQFIFLVWS